VEAHVAAFEFFDLGASPGWSPQLAAGRSSASVSGLDR
jgi:hypothetical protein